MKITKRASTRIKESRESYESACDGINIDDKWPKIILRIILIVITSYFIVNVVITVIGTKWYHILLIMIVVLLNFPVFRFLFRYMTEFSNYLSEEKMSITSKYGDLRIVEKFASEHENWSEYLAIVDVDGDDLNNSELIKYPSILIKYSNTFDDSKFNSIYKYFRSNEEERIEEFVDISRRYLVKFLRIGIMGTFWGLLTSFILTAVSVSQGVNVQPENMATMLFGYAFAILSSLFSIGLGVWYEWSILVGFKNANLLNWIDTVYFEIFTSSDNISILNSSINSTMNIIDSLIIQIEKLSSEILSLNEILNPKDEEGKSIPIEISKTMHDLLVSAKEMLKVLSEFDTDDKSSDFTDQIKNLKTYIRILNERLPELLKSMGEDEDTRKLENTIKVLSSQVTGLITAFSNFHKNFKEPASDQD